MKKTIVLLFLGSFLLSCNQQKTFVVEGTVHNAEKKTLYIDYNGLITNTALDSVHLGKDGSFRFKVASPDYPDFYRLRIDNKHIVLAIDSIETIEIEADYDNFTDCAITGSESSVIIQNLRKSVIAIQRSINDLKPELTAAERTEKIAEIEQAIENHKQKAREIILTNARSTEAYFAIYQQINNTLLFNPYIQEDKSYVNAVATAYHTFMPEYVRSKNLYNSALDALKSEREAKQQQAWREVVETSGKGYIDIVLTDKNGTEQALSNFEGKVVLIDFSAYEMPENMDYTFSLRELYNNYNSKGLVIYQVSLDRNKLFWEQSVENIPWVCVRDENGPASTIARMYNVGTIPTLFLLDKNGNIVLRSSSFSEIEKNIRQLL